jgi:hypothetical protein
VLTRSLNAAMAVPFGSECGANRYGQPRKVNIARASEPRKSGNR